MNVVRDETAITHHGNGGMTLTGDAVHLYRVATIRASLSMLIKTDGRLRMTRTATPSALLRMTTEMTQKKYPNSKQGWATALADLDTRIAALKASIPVIDNRRPDATPST